MRIKKRASKRLGTKQREKVKKKVREHHRKSRKEAKRDPTWRTKKKQDPGIPNSFPYKEELLNEIQQRRTQAEQQRLAEREARRNGKAAVEASDDEEDAASANAEDVNMNAAEASTSVVSEPILFDGSLSSFLDGDSFDDNTLTLTLMLLDARDPLSWRVPQVEQALSKPATTASKTKKQTSTTCPIVYVLTRADLVPREQLAAWSANLSTTFDRPVFAVCSPVASQHGRPARAAAGIEALAAHIEKVVGSTKAKKTSSQAAVAVLGIENAGRTSLANILAASLPDISVFDTPALLPATSRLSNDDDYEEEAEDDADDDDELLQKRDREAAHRVLIRNAGSIFKIREPLPLIDAMMTRVAHVSDLMIAHNTPAFTDANDFLVGVARSAGRLKKGSIPDTTAAARTILHQWSTSSLGYYAKPPPAITEQDKERIASSRSAIEADASLRRVSLPRKEWRQKWQDKELRLTSGAGESGLLGNGKVAFAKVISESDDEDEVEQLMADVDEEDEEDDDEEEDDGDDDDDDDEDEDDEDDEEGEDDEA